MNYLRQKLVLFLTWEARQALERLDKNSAAALQLECLDIDAIIKNDIPLICETASLREITTILALAARFKSNSKDKEGVKDRIKKIASDIIGRIEEKPSGLKIPPSCLNLLFNLWDLS